MRRELWRISQYSGLTGIGGTYVDGRWHSKGKPIIYTAEHPALALLETMAHLDLSLDEIPDTLQLCRIEIEGSLPIYRQTLPVGWQANQVMSRKVGDQWLKAASEPFFEVPSAILPYALNVLINPTHPAVNLNVVEVSVEPIWIDSRFIR